MTAQGSAREGDSAHQFYISSPFLGLQKEREEAKQLITRQNHAYGDSYGGSPDPLVETCQRDVRASDHYILILGERYGTRRPEHGGKSVTELEFEAAVKAGRSLHAFFLGFVSDARNGIERDPEAHELLKAFRRRVSQHCVPVDCSDQEDGREGRQVFAEGIIALAANPPQKPGDRDDGNENKPPRSYTPAELESWVERHQPRLSSAFQGLPSVQARQVHVPLEVCLTPAGATATEGPRLLSPEDLAPVLESRGEHVLLLSGDGGAGKTSLAFAIGRWLLAGEPGGVVRLPVVLETAQEPGERVAGRVQRCLAGQLGDQPLELVEALLAAKRLIPIVDHLSELAPGAREQVLAALPPGLVIVTSRSDDDGFRERPLSRIEPQRIAAERLQAFFLDYLRRKGQGEALSDDDLIPAQAQLKRIVGDKPITVLLAQMFVDDVIANREEGLLAGSVPELMLSYVRRLDTPDRAEQRQRAGLVVTPELVQRALRVVALRSHRQGGEGKPLFQPLEFSEALAHQALMANKPEGLALTDEQSTAVLGYLVELRLLLQPGAAVGRLRFPLDPLADHLAAAEQFERLEEQALEQGAGVWEAFLASLETRAETERTRMRGFLLALRDGAQDAQGRRALAMPVEVPDRLAVLGFLDAEGERYRLALQRARKWVWELAEPEQADRLHAIRRLGEMSLPIAPDCQRKAAGTISPKFLARLAADPTKSDLERTEAVKAMRNLTAASAVDQLERLVIDEDLPLAAMNAAVDILSLRTLARLSGKTESSARWKRVMEEMHGRLQGEPLNLLASSEDDWAAIDRALIRLQASSRAVQQCATSEAVPLTGVAMGLSMPMLTLSTKKEENGWRVSTGVLHPAVWMVPLPAGQRLEVVRIPGGLYKVGPSVHPDCTQVADGAIQGSDSYATREVKVESHFFSRYAITHSQWEAVARLPRVYQHLEVKPWTFERKRSLGLGDWFSREGCNNLPVDSVSWWDCQEWLARLNIWLDEQWVLHGGKGLAPELTLPSPDLWEIACRAGSYTAFHFGDILDPGWALYRGSGGVGSPRAGINQKGPLPIGYFGLVNQWGLAEMHGQLFELCEREGARTSRGGIIPGNSVAGWSANPELISISICGGSWAAEAHECASSYRPTISSNRRDANVGFRPCCKA